MTARKSKAVRHRGPLAPRPRRYHAQLSLAAAEIKRLEATAAGDLRSVSNLVSKWVVGDLKRSEETRRRRRGLLAKPSDRRQEYNANVYLTAAQKRQVDALTRDEMRSFGNHVTRVVLGALRQG